VVSGICTESSRSPGLRPTEAYHLPPYPLRGSPKGGLPPTPLPQMPPRYPPLPTPCPEPRYKVQANSFLLDTGL